MNTTIIVDPALASLAHEQFRPLASSSERESLISNWSGRTHKTAAWYIASTEGDESFIYRYVCGIVYMPWGIEYLKTVDGTTLAASDFSEWEGQCGVPIFDSLTSEVRDYLSQLGDRYDFVYIVAKPSKGPDGLSYLIGEECAPVLVQRLEPFGKASALRKKQKHVSKPNTPKRRHGDGQL